MLSLLFSPALPLPSKFLRPAPPRPLAASKDSILMRALLSNRRLAAGRRRTMTDLARVGAFAVAHGGAEAEAEAEAEGEGEPVWGNGSSGFAWGNWEPAVNRVSKWLVAALFGLAILWKHDAEVLWATTGAVVNAGLSVVLKQILNHERPESASRSDPGMPSSHAQSIFYAAFYVVLSIIDWLGINVFTVTMAILILACGSYLSWLRISQRLHTVNQVLVGAVVGSTCGITWFWLWHLFILRAFIASVWVRLTVVLGTATFCVSFFVYVILHWLMYEQ